MNRKGEGLAMSLFFDKEEEQQRRKNAEIIASIVKTKTELNLSIKNYEYAEKELVDFYLYQIKANQAKLDYLIKMAKENKIEVSNVEKLKYEA